MTGGRKNEQFDIIIQAQMIVDEYEKKYFRCPSEIVLKLKKENKRKKAIVLFFIALIVIAAIMKIVL